MKFWFLPLFIVMLVVQSATTIFAQGAKEKAAILEKEFDKNQYDPILKQYVGANWDEFGDLFFEKNGKQYWLATFTAVISPNYD